MPRYKWHVLVCGAATCSVKGSNGILVALRDEIERRGLTEQVKIVETGCLGFSEDGPAMVVFPDAVPYCGISVSDIPKIVEEHLIAGRPVVGLFREKRSSGVAPYARPAHKKELRISLRNVGLVDPVSIQEYIARGGYDAAAKALTRLRPDGVIGLVKDSGLRGRSGGSPTGLKWESIAENEGKGKLVICTADDGEPGSFKDRAILEGDPHGVIEGMLIAGYAIGASKGLLYLRDEYRGTEAQIEWALESAREMGFLGRNIMNSGFDFDIEVFRAPGAHIGSEDSAVLESIEGGRGEPRSTDLKLGDRPVLVNNVETLTNIPPIVMNGADWFFGIGTEKSRGTKVLSISGDVAYPGTYEVPFGTTMREVVYEMAGGVKNGHRLKAVLVGGLSGTCVSDESLDRGFAFEDLSPCGGSIIALDDSRCILGAVKSSAEYFARETCGQCTPCREGTKRILELMKWWSTGAGSAGDLVLVQRLGETMALAAKCGFGQGAANVFRSSLPLFEAEYKAHIINKTCPAGTCAMEMSEECEPCR